ncbi:arabinan endo-1,5-alpha-L-arabinosidase [Aurantiacibacter luteus]|uniref:Extracellular exo-alpha-(1->5)-L-arabinofuranosidase n=1 Tax=Aurantiacibacter luteus TaxID=1581420 RepID=A0A0G9MZE3_9SPHN|nr:arabinan endo-1,5-alpha-L-arabinosidase [Aurantiacibacter luteus]KLE35954.1 ABC transporter substrate-binding protein [Aurantiacibacter luteus]
MLSAVRTVVATLAAALASACAAVEVPTAPAVGSLALTGDIVPAHDPVLIREGSRYYAYSTGLGGRLPLTARYSDDMAEWHSLPSPIAVIPDWAREMVPTARGFWAPDVERVGGQYRLYYSVSTFGSRNSAIGLATSVSLDPNSPDYGWRDEGLVVRSSDDTDYNAIDPDFQIDREGRHWLVFGSFWGGIQLVELDPATGIPPPGAQPRRIARRDAAANWAIEAPFIVEHGGWYYLIVGFDHCCRAEQSDYKLAMSRARDIGGPYLDRDGSSMLEAGGTILLEADADDRFRGPGHAGYFLDRDGEEYLVFHGYDSRNDGRATLRLAKLGWDEAGWPVIEGNPLQ